MPPVIQNANVTISGSGTTAIITNPFKNIAQANTHGQVRGAVIRVMAFNVQNQDATKQILATWQDSNGSNIAGPFVIPSSPGNWTERSTPNGFLFETTRNSTSGVGFDLNINTNTAVAGQIWVEYAVSWAPGRVGA